jgi:hypothetical protein
MIHLDPLETVHASRAPARDQEAPAPERPREPGDRHSCCARGVARRKRKYS